MIELNPFYRYKRKKRISMKQEENINLEAMEDYEYIAGEETEKQSEEKEGSASLVILPLLFMIFVLLLVTAR